MLETTKQKNSLTGSLQQGFTLVELMVVITVLLVLLVVAVPGLSSLIRNNQMVTDTYALRATLNNARSEAITRRARVVVCPTTDGSACVSSSDWSTGYMTFVDTDQNTVPDPNDPAEELIQWEPRSRAMEVLFDSVSGAQTVAFSSRGIALGSEGTFLFCDERGAAEARGLQLTPVGSVRSAIGAEVSAAAANFSSECP
ncbi:hypothetical protein GCM10007052_25190 [Halioglobus japonicus]|uniref:GspH/FimT family pseudopilin n=1 Tax=Halioglobus japonicus TaxID=930805 RepID=UPI001475DAD1|nr:GspH/FimT family protein [Halioglobus japonicus]GHD18024.1 hypothetical protein GCM10007052_25190 [Halioglobus japonicus]